MSRKFYKLPQDLCSRKDLQASDKILFAVILNYQGDNGKCWPGISSLMRDTGFARQTVLDSIRRLELSGDLEVIRRGKGKANHYKTSLNIRPVEKSNQSKNQTTNSPDIRPEVVQILDPKRKDLKETTTHNNYSFVLRSEALWYLPQEKLREYRQTYNNGIDIDFELRKAAQWLIDHPDRRKTEKGMYSFLNGWLNRTEPRPEPQRGDPDWLPTEEEANELMKEITLDS